MELFEAPFFMSETSAAASRPNVFCGNAYACLMAMHRYVGVQHWLMPSDNYVSDVIRGAAEREGIRISKFDNKSEAMALLESVGQGRFLQLVGFKYRLTAEQIKRFDKVYNLHPGSLENRRGREPMHQAVLHGDRHFYLTQHEVLDEELDAGPVNIVTQIPVNYQISFVHNVDNIIRAIVGMLNTHYMTYRDNLVPLSMPVDIPENSYLSRLSKAVIDEVENASTLEAFQQRGKTAVLHA